MLKELPSINILSILNKTDNIAEKSRSHKHDKKV